MSTRGMLPLTCFVLAALGLAGCLARHDAADEDLPLEAFCGAFFDALCEPLEACGCGPAAVALCRAEEAALCRNFPSDALVEAIDLGRLHYDEVAARRLLQAMAERATSCVSFTEAIDWKVRDLFGFGGVFEGRVRTGEACSVLGFELISECEFGSCTAIGGEYACRSAVGRGERCDGLHHCANLDAPLTLELGIEHLSLRCIAQDEDGGICTARGPEGGECTSDADCEHGACEGRCRARELGEPCRIARHCASGHCDAESRTCQPGDAPVGASCADHRECASDLCVAGTCLPAGCATF